MRKSLGDINLIPRNGFNTSKSLSPVNMQSVLTDTASSRNQKTVIGAGKQINRSETTENMRLVVLSRLAHRFPGFMVPLKRKLSYLYCKEKEQVMTTLDSIKNRLIDRILAVQNEKFLEAIEKIFVTTQKEEIVKLYPEQMEMLMMSDADIASGNVVSEAELDKQDSQWMYLKIVWTATALQQRNFIFHYWNERNKSNLYSKKLNSHLKQRIEILKTHPNIGKPTEHKNTRVISLGHFSIFYRKIDSIIYITAFWDNRQNPKRLIDFLKAK